MTAEPFVFTEAFIDATGRERFRVGTYCESAAEANDVGLMLKARKPARAYVVAGSLTDADLRALAEATPGVIVPLPPNCDHNPIGYAYAGEALAQAQHEAATDGDECTSGACLLTRGSD